MQQEQDATVTYLRAVLDAFPASVLVVDQDFLIHDCNRAARDLLAANANHCLQRPCGEALQCLHATMAGARCGATPRCETCTVRQAVDTAMSGQALSRVLYEMATAATGAEPRRLWFRVSAAPINYGGKQRALVTLEDVTELVDLRRLLPICAQCHKVRDGADYWQDVESYLEEHTAIGFTHGICPACIKVLYPELGAAGEGSDTPSAEAKQP